MKNLIILTLVFFAGWQLHANLKAWVIARQFDRLGACTRQKEANLKSCWQVTNDKWYERLISFHFISF